jgi:hypothetical protein
VTSPDRKAVAADLRAQLLQLVPDEQRVRDGESELFAAAEENRYRVAALEAFRWERNRFDQVRARLGPLSCPLGSQKAYRVCDGVRHRF